MRGLFPVALAMLAVIACTISGCGSCEDGKVPDEHVERQEESGVELVGDAETFNVQVKKITASSIDDGLLGGSSEEPKFTLACGGATSDFEQSFSSGQSEVYGDATDTSDEDCFYAGIMTVNCPAESDVYLWIREEDSFSSAETGSIKIPWEIIQFMTHGMQTNFEISTSSTGEWDKFWAWMSDVTGGICITDLIPSAKTAKALHMSAKAVKRIKKANKAIKRYEKAQKKLEKCDERTGWTGVSPCGDAFDTMGALWDMQCLQADTNGGVYTFVVQFSASTRVTISFASLAFGLSLIMLFP